MERETTLRRIVALVVPLILTAALVAVCIWGADRAARAEALETQVESIYRHTFFELSDNVSDMQVALKKLAVAGSSAQYVQLLTEVRRLSGAAGANLGNLPAAHTDTADISRFVAQTGDYAHQLSIKVLRGAMPAGEDREQLNALYEASVQLAASLEERLANEDFPVETVTAETYYGAAADEDSAEGGDASEGAQSGDGSGADGNGASGQASGGNGASNGASSGQAAGSDGTSDGAEADAAAQAGTSSDAKEEESVSNYPTLIYDGPFSDSTEKAEPRGLPDGEVDERTALQAAVDALGGAALTLSGETGGTIAAYNYSGMEIGGRSVEISITKRGGRVLYMMMETRGAGEGVPDENTTAQLERAGKDYLDAHGYDAMESTYAQYYAGIAVFNFASTQDGVLLYPDLVKVYVERESGQVVGVDAQNYLFCHQTRTLPAPALTEQQARDAVSDALKIDTVRLALIPKTVMTEVLCYECTGTYGDASFAVYINAETGAEEELFEIINSDEGTFTV